MDKSMSQTSSRIMNFFQYEKLSSAQNTEYFEHSHCLNAYVFRITEQTDIYKCFICMCMYTITCR